MSEPNHQETLALLSQALQRLALLPPGSTLTVTLTVGPRPAAPAPPAPPPPPATRHKAYGGLPRPAEPPTE